MSSPRWSLALLVAAACQNSAAPAPPRPSAGAATAAPRAPSPSPLPPALPRALGGVTLASNPASVVAPPGPRPPIHGGGTRVVTGKGGMVVSVEAHATRAGVEVLGQGGNAMDAAVAVALALAVTHPSAGNLGGGGFILYRPRGGPTVAIEFREKAPRAVTQPLFDSMIAAGAEGPAAVAVPGTVAGLNLGLARFGRLPRAQVFAPALGLAEDGFRLGGWQARTLAWAWPSLAKDRALRSTFGTAGKPKTAGTLLRQPELAATLERIAREGDPGFYTGPTATAIAALTGHGGLVSLEDLAGYRAVVRDVLAVPYRGYTVELPPPPSAGGPAVAILLRLSERLEAFRFPALSADEAHLFAETARRAHALRRFDVGDPDSVPGFDLAAKRRTWLDPDLVLAASPPIDGAHATPSAKVHPLFDAAMKELEDTTHFSVVDAEGNAASCTTTLSASFGAKVMAAGVVLNNALAAFGTVGNNTPAPQRRMTTSMSPTIVLADGSPVLVLGSPGGDTIPNTVVRVIRNVIDYGMTLDRAVDAPRLHHGFVPDELRYEAGRPPPRGVLAELRRRGHVLTKESSAIGDVNAIVLEGRTLYGYADPREGGLALGR